jgi:glycosyltransferase involved in cell wall biosynthesis
MDISVVIPLLNEQDSLVELHDWIAQVMQSNHLNYELIFIDDGSRDNSWSIIEKLCTKNPSVLGIRFAQNFGKSQALHAGFEKAKGEVIITMDADLQDSPDEIPELFQLIKKKKLDIVSG